MILQIMCAWLALTLLPKLYAQNKFMGKPLDSLGIQSGVSVSAWIDYNNDELPDVLVRYFTVPGVRLYKNLGNVQFQDVSLNLGININHSTSGMAVGDYNADGWQDIIILDRKSVVPGTTHVYKNINGTHFVDIAVGTQLSISGDGESAAFADFDGDGDQDIMMLFYEQNTITGEDGFGSPKLFRNDGGDLFTDVTATAGIIPNRSYNLTSPIINGEGLGIADFDGDGDLDMHYAGHIFRNDGNLVFYDVPFSESNLPAVFDEGSGFIDYDNDGIFDIVKSINSNFETYIYKGTGNLNFYRIYDFLFPTAPTYKWAIQAIDFDADGYTDLGLSAGAGDTITGNSSLLRNKGDATFECIDSLVSPLFLTDSSGQVESGSWADIDQDGDLDLFGGNINTLYFNHYNNQNYIDVKATNQNSVFNQHGSTLRLYQAGSTFPPYQMLDMGFSNWFLSFGNYAAKFGMVPGNTYDLNVCFPSVAGQTIVVDKDVNSKLGGIRTEDLSNTIDGRVFEVRRNGVVSINGISYPPENGTIVTLHSPVNRVNINHAHSVLLNWRWEGGHKGTSISYDVQVAEHSNFDSLYHVFSNLNLDSLRVYFDHPGMYFWRVRSNIDGQPYPWSDIFQFTLGNNSPVIVSLSDSLAKEDSLFISHITAYDEDSLFFADYVRYRIEEGPGWLIVDSVTGVLSGKPTNNSEGGTSLSITAYDRWGGSSQKTWNINILPTNYPPSYTIKFYPLQDDTLTLFKNASYKSFIWASSKDPDLKDTLLYRFELKTNDFDTVITGIRDTTLMIDERIFSEMAHYEWQVYVTDGEFVVSSPDTFRFQTTKRVANSTYTEAPTTFFLYQNYPNPFNPSTFFRFQIPEESDVRIEVYNILGQRVDQIFNGKLSTKYYEMEWRPKAIASGIYFVKFNAEGIVSRKKYQSVRKLSYIK